MHTVDYKMKLISLFDHGAVHKRRHQSGEGFEKSQRIDNIFYERRSPFGNSVCIFNP